MNLSRSRTLLMRTSAVAALTAAALAGGSGIAPAAFAAPDTHAAPGAPGAPGDRTVSVSFKNKTGLKLKLDSAYVTEGAWTVRPPKAIKKLKSARFASTSTKAEGGTSADVNFLTPTGGKVQISYTNYWDSAGSYSCYVPDELACTVKRAPGADFAKVTYTLFEG